VTVQSSTRSNTNQIDFNFKVDYLANNVNSGHDFSETHFRHTLALSIPNSKNVIEDSKVYINWLSNNFEISLHPKTLKTSIDYTINTSQLSASG
jgi:hypothetical protein